MHSKMFNEGEFIEGKAQWRLSMPFWTRQDIAQLNAFYF